MFNEYPRPATARTPFLPVKIKNTIRRRLTDNTVPALVFDLKTITRNGYKFGTSGFVRNPKTGVVIYIHTDSDSFTPPILYRFAKDEKDFRGGQNHFCTNPEELAEAVYKMMSYPNEQVQVELHI